MSSADKKYNSLVEWIASEAISFSINSDSEFNDAIDRVVGKLRDEVQLLGLGEPTHGLDAFLEVRNRLFRRLVEVHGFGAIAIESSFTRGRVAGIAQLFAVTIANSSTAENPK
jgi:erythromycin esterase